MSAEPPPPTPSEPDRTGHDPTGSDLARAVAAAYRGLARRTVGRARGPVAGWGNRRRGEPPAAQSSGARPGPRDPRLLDTAVQRLVTEQGWDTEVAVHGLFGRWETIVGVELAAHCRPERFVDGRLTVRADSTAWATQVRLLAPLVLERLNTELGGGTVQRIDVDGPATPSWRHGRFAVRDGRGPRDTYG